MIHQNLVFYASLDVFETQLNGKCKVFLAGQGLRETVGELLVCLDVDHFDVLELDFLSEPVLLDIDVFEGSL